MEIIDFFDLVCYAVSMANYKNAIINSKAFKTVLKDKASNRLSHTYLLLSEDMEYCKAFAKFLSKEILELNDNSAGIIKLDKDIHPDIIIKGETEKLVTSVAAEISTDVFVRPYESDKKVYILLNMQDTNEETQNKLLKTIEEPPESTFFILASKTERKLLQTVLSRCKKIDLDLLTKNQIEEMLQEEGVNEKTVNICSACSGGFFSRALKMASDKEFLSLHQNIFNCLGKMNSSRDVLNFASIFSGKNVNKEEFADIFMLIARDVACMKAGTIELISNAHKQEELKMIAQQFSLEALYKIIEYCLQLKEDLVYNTNLVASIDEFLLKVVEVKVKCRK